MTAIESDRGDGDITRAGSVLGTPAYMPPEQAIGAVDQVDPRSDVFGLGAMLCALLTGKPPYAGADSEATRQLAARARLDDAFARLDGCGAEPELVALCKRCLAAEKTGRPADAGVVARAVADLREAADARARRAELDRTKAEAEAREQRKRPRVQLALAVAIGLLLVGGGAVAWYQDRQAAQRRTETESRERDEQDRLGRNAERIEDLLNQCDAALADDDADRAAVPLAEAERRAAEGGADRLADRLTRCRADFDLLHELDRLNGLRLSLSYESTDVSIAAGQVTGVAKAFARYGIVPGTTPAHEAVRIVNESRVPDRLLNALDAWLVDSTTPDADGPLPGPGSVELVALLRAVDPDPYRDAVRDAIAAHDRERLKELAGQPRALEQPARFVTAVAGLLGVSAERKHQLLVAALRRRPNDFGVLVSLGLGDPAQPSDGEKWFRAAVAARPRSGVAHFLLGYAMGYWKNDGDAALAEYEEAVRLSPESALYFAALGTARLRKGDRNGAIAAYQESVRLDPAGYRSEGAYESLQKLRQRVDVDRAIAAHKEAIRLHPNSPAHQSRFGDFLQSVAGDLGGASQAYRAAIRLEPKKAMHQFSLGGILQRTKDLAGAVAAFREACHLDPTYSLYHIALAHALREHGKLDEAIAEWREVCGLAPKVSNSRIELADALLDHGEFDEALTEWREAIRLAPSLVNTLATRAHARREKGDLDGSKILFQEMVRRRRELVGRELQNPSAHWFLGNALRDAGSPDEAEAAYREAVRLDGEKHGAALDSLADLHRSRGSLIGPSPCIGRFCESIPRPHHRTTSWRGCCRPGRIGYGTASEPSSTPRPPAS